ncbi:hypothetical protein AMTR_s00040p00219170 [Amborella trichopoda]|uniref:Uncharacterized protein n=1 Tax=Amborella trichopoda TaxID=13333 RepID=W1PT71_AMBTC|nr:hypothetical protein AMTR_s00040p00219170 [Amborella trichopoda]
MAFTATKHVCDMLDYYSKKMRQEETMDIEHGKPWAIEHDKTETGKEMRKEGAMEMEKGGMNQEAEVIADELVAVSMTAPKFLKSKFRRLTGFTILDEKEDMHAIEDLET